MYKREAPLDDSDEEGSAPVGAPESAREAPASTPMAGGLDGRGGPGPQLFLMNEALFSYCGGRGL